MMFSLGASIARNGKKCSGKLNNYYRNHNDSLKYCRLRQRHFGSSSSSSSTNASSTGEDHDSTTQQLTAVIRYDNNCATIPYIGAHDKAQALKQRMEANTHKHHIYLVECNLPKDTTESSKSISLGPYATLEEAKKALGYSNDVKR